ncbi:MULTISPECIES: hypothetical protein [unclassified Mesorhizobium]|uniref:hypothetical protein n=1 Tax=unclassified Mesorhizobium TaxID=325217 RepID=UPI000FD78B72|nr:MULTISPECIES: hypothetical protein [unclassified Mesorhizobium]TGT76754.1 hypothetical protein EN809_003895 [Mesorhizobium sp. M2E.F.Ca.ET.166.01.1.1]TGW02866.1 hypothetical protein EN797_003895 [Mesorhizobium sp. M2E.F.Ca.ET.154.01.1.1]
MSGTAKVSLCRKCGMPIGMSCVLVSDKLYHVECNPITSKTPSERRIEELEAQLSRLREAEKQALAEIERMTPKYVAYEYLESPAGREVAEARVAVLEKALERCQSVLAMLIGGEAGMVTSAPGIMSAYAQCVEAEAVARRALQGGGDNG